MADESSKSLESLFEVERNFISNASNFAAYIFHTMENLNWTGFYFMSGGELLLGPFQGKVACVRIPLGKGVCGTAAEKRQTVVVDDVRSFAGHIACDADSRSEIVIPVIANEVLYGVLDIDSPVPGRFGEKERFYLEKILTLLIEASDISDLKKYY